MWILKWLYWINKGGCRPYTYLLWKNIRTLQVLACEDLDAQGRFAPVGQGTLDFAKYLA